MPVIVTASSKGGAGKSTLTLVLAQALDALGAACTECSNKPIWEAWASCRQGRGSRCRSRRKFCRDKKKGDPLAYIRFVSDLIVGAEADSGG